MRNEANCPTWTRMGAGRRGREGAPTADQLCETKPIAPRTRGSVSRFHRKVYDGFEPQKSFGKTKPISPTATLRGASSQGRERSLRWGRLRQTKPIPPQGREGPQASTGGSGDGAGANRAKQSQFSPQRQEWASAFITAGILRKTKPISDEAPCVVSALEQRRYDKLNHPMAPTKQSQFPWPSRQVLPVRLRSGPGARPAYAVARVGAPEAAKTVEARPRRRRMVVARRFRGVCWVGAGLKPARTRRFDPCVLR